VNDFRTNRKLAEVVEATVLMSLLTIADTPRSNVDRFSYEHKLRMEWKDEYEIEKETWWNWQRIQQRKKDREESKARMAAFKRMEKAQREAEEMRAYEAYLRRRAKMDEQARMANARSYQAEQERWKREKKANQERWAKAQEEERYGGYWPRPRYSKEPFPSRFFNLDPDEAEEEAEESRRVRHPPTPPKQTAPPTLGETDFYTLTGVARNATQKEINTRHHVVVNQLHPDKNRDKNGKLIEGQYDPKRWNTTMTAFDILRNPSTREEYDRMFDREEHGERVKTFRSERGIAGALRK